MKRMNFPKRREQRRIEAEERQEARNERTDMEQLTVLRERGHGHCKEAGALFMREHERVHREVQKLPRGGLVLNKAK